MAQGKPVTLKKVLKVKVEGKTLEYFTPTGEKISLQQYRSAVVPSKKNQRRAGVTKSGRPFIMPSQAYIDWINEHMKIFDDWYYELYNEGKISLPIVRCKIKILFYFPDSKDRDLDNKYTTISDCLKMASIIADDSFKVVKPIMVDGWIMRDKPRTEIYLTIIPSDSKEYEVDKTNHDKWKKEKLQRRATQRRLNYHKSKGAK